MLRARIHLDDDCSSWSQVDGCYVWGTSTVEPFRTPAVTTTCERQAAGLRLVASECRPCGDAVTIEVQPGRVRVTAGVLGVVPVYLATDGRVLHVAWDVADLAEHAHPDAIVARVVARLLTRRQRYSRETLFAGITRLTAGSTVTFDGTGLSYRYPAPAEHVLRARELRDGADPVTAFTRLLESRVSPVLSRHPGTVAVELSGGLDSANVATTAARHAAATARRLTSLGLLVDGAAGIEQRTRRARLVTALNLHDLTVRAADHLPFTPDGPRTICNAHDADGDVYREAFDVARRDAAQAGARIVLTGFGGDEMLALRAAERQRPVALPDLAPWLTTRTRDALDEVDAETAPATAVAVPCLLAFSARHPAYLHAGLWPIAPLADPALLRLGESLPVPFRAGKALFRDRLTRAGFPRSVTHPRTPESFADTMTTALRRHGIPILAGMLDHSLLIEHGYVDRSALATLLGAMRAGAPAPDLLYDTVAVEIGLRSMTGTCDQAPNAVAGGIRG